MYYSNLFVLWSLIPYRTIPHCLLFPLSCQSKSAKQRGEYMEARTKSQWSLWLNVSALISYLALMILGVGLLLVVLLTF